MVDRRLVRLAAIGTATVLATAGLVSGASPAVAATKPVINGPVFNDPLGTSAEQRAIFDQLLNLINATPAGETIRVAMFDFNDIEIANALNAAHDRGVNVKVILDDSTYTTNGVTKTTPAWDSLKNPTTGLGSNDTAPSWVVVCDDQFEDNDGVDDVARGCVSTPPPTPAYMHNKFFLFSKVGPFADGTSFSKVVFQSSSNLTDWYKVESYNDSVTFVDATVYDGYAKYHEDMRALRHTAAGNNHYYWSTPTGSTYRAFFFPRADSTYTNPASDSMVNALDEVSCAYTGTDGLRHQTDVRVVVLNFLDSRIQLANKLASLRAAGCWIDVIYTPASSSKADNSPNNDQVRQVLTNAGIQHLACWIETPDPEVDVRVHNKFMLLDGDYNGGITPRVYTGSPNWDGSSLRSSDEALVRITSASYHAAYLSYFYKIRTACRAGVA